ncbi:MAG: tetratricopeptide repeat protein, partial [Planctomycetales bacterium]|nr:tetratricopeptide repeat protein [Planctomycetales bacterium]
MPPLRPLLLFLLGLAAMPLCCLAQPAPARSAGAAYTSAAALQDRGLYDLAAKEWLAMLRAHPEDPLASRARYNLGVCRFQQGDFSAAAKEFQAAATGKYAESVAAAAWANLGLARFNLASSLPPEQQPAASEGYRQAVAAFDRLLKEFPQSSQVATSHYYRGESLAALGETAEAAKSFSAVLTDPNASALHEASRISLARAELESGEPAKAEATLNSLLAATPAGAPLSEAYLLRGEARLAAGNPQAAAEDFAKAAADADPAAMDSVLERHAFALYTGKDYANASDLYARLANRYPDSPLAADARVACAKCLMLSGLDRQAERAFAKLWNAAPTADNAEAAHWLVQTLLKRGKHEEAAQLARQALATSPPPQWRAPLQLALADGLSEQPDGQREALQLFTRYAREHAGA